MSIKLVAFDWNGTLLADTFSSELIDNKILKHYGLPPITIKKFRETFDVPVSKYWKALGVNERLLKQDSKNFFKMWPKLYEPVADKCRTRSGVRETLKYLDSKKISCVIYSNHTVPDIQRQLNRLKLSDLISQTLARKDAEDRSHNHYRSKDQKLASYVKKHKFKPHEVISIGDTEEEIEIAKKLGYYSVALTGGYNSTPRLKKHHPDFLIHNMKELMSIIKKLNKS